MSKRKRTRPGHTTGSRKHARVPLETEVKATEVPDVAQGAPHKLQTSVDEESYSNFYLGITNDISEGGVFVAVDKLVPKGTMVHLELELPDGDGVVSVDGSVRWIRQYSSEGAPRGLGVQFTRLQEDLRVRIEKFVRRRDPVFYDD